MKTGSKTGAKKSTKPVAATNLVINEFSSAAPVVTSAIIIQPPKELWTSIQAIRQTHDKGTKNRY